MCHAELVSASGPESPAIDLTDSIKLVRGQRVIVDSDLASLYGVPTKRLNEAVKKESRTLSCGFCVPTECRGAIRFEVAICDFKARARWATQAHNGIH